MRSTKESPIMHLDEKLETTAKVMPTNTFENERVSWKIEELNAIKELFCKEIEAKSITMAVVREKIQNHPTLNSISPKKLLTEFAASGVVKKMKLSPHRTDIFHRKIAVTLPYRRQYQITTAACCYRPLPVISTGIFSLMNTRTF